MGAEVVAGGLDNSGGDFVKAEIIGLDFEVRGFLIVWSAFLQKVPNCFFGVIIIQKGAI